MDLDRFRHCFVTRIACAAHLRWSMVAVRPSCHVSSPRAVRPARRLDAIHRPPRPGLAVRDPTGPAPTPRGSSRDTYLTHADTLLAGHPSG
jgi:hypothetical protein